MNWDEMKRIEPRLSALEAVARDAGRDEQRWFETWVQRLYEPLSKLVGPMSNGRLRSARDFEKARKALLLVWAAAGNEAAIMPPWEIPEGETEPLPPALLPAKH